MKTLNLNPITGMLLGAFLAFVAHAPGAAAENDGRTVIPAAAKPQGPFTIDQPGSYCLGGNRYATGTAIQVLTNNVTIDLNGFCLVGSETGKTHGVFLKGVRNVEIRNGTLMNFGDRAIAGEGHQEGVRILNVRILDSGACGVCLDVSGLYMKDCYVARNKMTGICPGVYATLLNNIVCSNGAAGMLAGWGCLIDGNSVFDNQHVGIYAMNNSRVENNMVMNNNLSADAGRAGILIRAGSLVRNNVLRDNQVAGIRALEGDNLIEGNLITYAQTGKNVAIACPAELRIDLSRNCCSTNGGPDSRKP